MILVHLLFFFWDMHNYSMSSHSQKEKKQKLNTQVKDITTYLRVSSTHKQQGIQNKTKQNTSYLKYTTYTTRKGWFQGERFDESSNTV